jgi:hypothetical protein
MFRFRRRVVRWKLSLADIAAQMKRKPGKRVVISPLAFEAVQRIDRIFAIERDINGRPAAERLAVRQSVSAPLVTALGNWMREQRGLLSANDAVGKKMDYMLNAGPAFTAFLDDGQICLTNNAAERALRAIASGRKAWLFVGSDRGGERAAIDLRPHRHLSAQRCRSARLAHRRAHTDRRHIPDPPPRVAAWDLATDARTDRYRSDCLITFPAAQTRGH